MTQPESVRTTPKSVEETVGATVAADQARGVVRTLTADEARAVWAERRDRS